MSDQLTEDVLDMMQQLYEMHSRAAVERFSDCLQRYAPALLACARRDMEQKKRIAELESAARSGCACPCCDFHRDQEAMKGGAK